MRYLALIAAAPGLLWQRLPAGVQKAIVDALETGLAAALTIDFVLPETVGDARHTALVLWAAFAGAAIAALRRGLLVWITARREART